MDKSNALAALAALAQEHRLKIYRSLVQASPDGMAAGNIATAVGIAHNTLSFHLDRLRDAGLIKPVRNGRSVIYTAQHGTMRDLLGYLADNCVPVRGTNPPTRPKPRAKKG